MRGLFAGLLKARRALVPKAGVMIQQRAIKGKPPKDEIRVLETVFVFTALFTAILGPSGWILAHIDDYKS